VRLTTRRSSIHRAAGYGAERGARRPTGGGLLNLGWMTTLATPARLSTLPMTAANISAAKSALLMFNYSYMPVGNFSYTIKGTALRAPSPFSATIWAQGRSVALPVPLTALAARLHRPDGARDRALRIDQ
jgi:hypothetical protein